MWLPHWSAGPPVTSLQSTPPSALGRGPTFRSARREGGSRLQAPPPDTGDTERSCGVERHMALSQQTQQALLSPLGSGMKLNLPMKWKIFHVSRSPCKQRLLGGSIFSVLLSSHASSSGVSCRLQLPGRRAQPVPEAAFSRSTTPGSDRLRGHGILPPPPFRPPLPRQGLQGPGRRQGGPCLFLQDFPSGEMGGGSLGWAQGAAGHRAKGRTEAGFALCGITSIGL